MRKGCCRMAAAFSLRKEYQMTGKNERKLKKWAALFLAAAMSLTACGSIASTGSSTSSASGTSAVSESSTSTASAADVPKARRRAHPSRKVRLKVKASPKPLPRAAPPGVIPHPRMVSQRQTMSATHRTSPESPSRARWS